MYNNLYILHKDNYYWTCIGNDSEYSKKYRLSLTDRYELGSGWVEIGMIPTNSEAEAKELQLKINTVFKPFIIVNSVILITHREYHESDENGKIELKQVTVGKTFVYNEESGEKLEHTLSGQEITISEPYINTYIISISNYRSSSKPWFPYRRFTC